MQEVKSITLVLENCEELSFSRSQIGLFWCEEIYSSIFRIACNCISKCLFCKELFLELNKSADQKYNTFGHESEITSFQRLITGQDITHIEINYDDGSKDYIAVPWNEKNNYTNLYQSYTVSKCGHLYLLISSGKNILDVLDEKINDQEAMSVHWDLLSK